MVNSGTSANFYQSDYMSSNLQKIDITCDQITFNPLDETITILACEFKDNQSDKVLTGHKVLNPCINSIKEPIVNNRQKIEQTPHANNVKERTRSKANTSNELNVEDGHWLVQASTVDKICLGVIFMLMVIWLTVFVYYELREKDFLDNGTHIDSPYTDDRYD